jgi:mannose-6-phosphate isomerase-like protein (cupin superfamily)
MAKRRLEFRGVIATGEHSQLVLMSTPAGEEIDSEIHPHTDQILFVLDGEGRAVVNGQRSAVGKKDVVFVPAGTEHSSSVQGA